MNIEDVVRTLPNLPQRQDSEEDQLKDLVRVAVKLGMYDAADMLQALIKGSARKRMNQ